MAHRKENIITTIKELKSKSKERGLEKLNKVLIKVGMFSGTMHGNE